MDVVFAMASGHVAGPDGLTVYVRKGSHWPTSDPVVRATAGMFSTDPRWGMCFSVPVPDVEAEPEPAAVGRRRQVPA